MDMRQLRYFVQIVESGSLAKASRQLYIAQPALSQQMARLEDEVGRMLLVRSSRGVTPTENGDALYHHAKFMLRQLDQAVSVARQERAHLTGRVAIGLAPTTVCQLGKPLIEHFRQHFPGVQLNIVEGHSGHLEHMARNGQLDLAVLFRPNAAAELKVEPLIEEELFVILPLKTKHVAAQCRSLTLKEVAALPLIMPSSGHGLRRRITLEFERVNLTVDAVAEIDSLPLLMQCVGEDMGATIKPTAAVHALGASAAQWRCLSISDASMSRSNYLYSLSNEKLSACADMARKEVKTVVSHLVNDGIWDGVKLIIEDAAVPAEHILELEEN